jgi:hypothetical protein
MCKDKYDLILKGLIPYGTPAIWGSASRGKEYYHNHDVDIGLITNFKSKEFLKEKCVKITKEYMGTPLRHTIIGNNVLIKRAVLPLHFIIIGNFSYEFDFVTVSNVVHIMQFIPRNWRYIIWIRVIIKKLKKSLLKKF